MHTSYTLKISSQGQLTLPRDLRERLHVRPGSRVVITAADNGELQIYDKLPIEKHFGTMANVWTTPGQDAADYTRTLRNTMQPKQ
jgi:AbrB family looped-hinge helix DNA binding protein